MELQESTLLNILKQMLRIRRFEECLYQMYLNKQVPGMSPHLSVGQEAVAVGACLALEKNDYLLTTHRGHGHVLAKGADMRRMLAEIMGKETGYCHGRGGSMHIADANLNILGANGIVGGGLPIALGSALASKYRKSNRVTLCFFGDAASNIGSFHESLNMAGIFKLPVVWVCENNQYGLSTKITDSLACESIGKRAAAYSMDGFTVDGNDVLAVYQIVKQAVDTARQGRGSTLIEAITYRWYGHGASDNRSYRTRQEEYRWKKKCPIKRFKFKLVQEVGVAEDQIKEMEEEVSLEVAEARKFAEDSSLPDPEEVMKYIYSDNVKEISYERQSI